MDEPTPTHTGWFLFCPIYLAETGTDAPIVWERKPWMLPLFNMSERLMGAAIWCLTAIDPDYEPAWMFWRVRVIDYGVEC